MAQKTFVIDIDSEEEIYLKQSENSQYEFATPNGDLKIHVEQDRNSGGQIIRLKSYANMYARYYERIKGTFEAQYNEFMQMQKENFEGGFENVDEGDEQGIKIPYDPKLIMVAPAKFSLKEIVGMIDGEEDDERILDLSPDFQRDYVWDNVRKSRLIESILLNIPLPMFYFARDKEGKLQVVDGVQRLTTIYKFFHNEFKLAKLEYLDECEGRYFKNADVDPEKNLPPKLMRALRQYQIDCNIIEPSTPENVKLDIFKRLNTGGKELNKQEVRHAFMKKNVREFIKKLVNMKEFQAATDYSINDNRMMAQELILRYIGFYCIYIDNFLQVEYSTKMDEFIDDVAVRLNGCKEIPYDAIYQNFQKAMCLAAHMFGKCAFRKLELDEKGTLSNKKNPINKSLFIAFSVILSTYPVNMVQSKGDISQEFAEFLAKDDEFYYSISHNTNYQLRDVAVGKIRHFMNLFYGKD